jgi:hypothetical protein
MIGQAVVITDPLAGMVLLMRGGWSSNCRLKRVVQADRLSTLSVVWARRWCVKPIVASGSAITMERETPSILPVLPRASGPRKALK